MNALLTCILSLALLVNAAPNYAAQAPKKKLTPAQQAEQKKKLAELRRRQAAKAKKAGKPSKPAGAVVKSKPAPKKPAPKKPATPSKPAGSPAQKPAKPDPERKEDAALRKLTDQLLLAIKRNDLKAVQEALNQEGVDVNVEIILRGEKGDQIHSPLFMAAMTASPEIVQALLDKAANVQKKQPTGASILDFSFNNPNPKTIELLLSKLPITMNTIILAATVNPHGLSLLLKKDPQALNLLPDDVLTKTLEFAQKENMQENVKILQAEADRRAKAGQQSPPGGADILTPELLEGLSPAIPIVPPTSE